MKQFRRSIMISLLLISLSTVPAAFAANNGHHGPRPYGGYCMGNRWGWYGAHSPVKTIDEARRHFEKYFEGRDIIVGEIVDKGIFFRAEISDAKENVLDFVIIDKRTGRIRSLY